MSRIDIKYIVKIILFFGSFLLFMFFLQQRGIRIERELHFQGVIEEIVFDEKGYPKVTVNGQSFFVVSVSRDFIKQISLGDSIIKKSNSLTYTLIKRNTGRIILSE